MLSNERTLKAWFPAVIWLVVIAIESTNAGSSENTGRLLYPISYFPFFWHGAGAVWRLPSRAAQDRPFHWIFHAGGTLVSRLVGYLSETRATVVVTMGRFGSFQHDGSSRTG